MPLLHLSVLGRQVLLQLMDMRGMLLQVPPLVQQAASLMVRRPAVLLRQLRLPGRLDGECGAQVQSASTRGCLDVAAPGLWMHTK